MGAFGRSLKAPSIDLPLMHDPIVCWVPNRLAKAGFIPGISWDLTITFAKRMNVTRRRIEPTEREISHQSQSATIYLTRDRRLRVYAKTDRRVRFEVTFPDGYRSTSHRRSSFHSMEDFLLAVENLKAEAAQTLNDVFEHLWRWEEKHEMDATPDQLRAAIAAASETPFIATTIIHNLAKNGRLALAAGDPIRAAVQRLAQSNPPVLKTLKSDRRIYIVERRYEYARRNLGYP